MHKRPILTMYLGLKCAHSNTISSLVSLSSYVSSAPEIPFSPGELSARSFAEVCSLERRSKRRRRPGSVQRGLDPRHNIFVIGDNEVAIIWRVQEIEERWKRRDGLSQAYPSLHPMLTEDSASA